MMPKQLSATAPQSTRQATGDTVVGGGASAEEEVDLKDHLSKMELGFPTPTSVVSELGDFKASPLTPNGGAGKPIVVFIANAATLDTRGTSPVFPKIPTSTSPRPLMIDPAYGGPGSQTHIPLSPLLLWLVHRHPPRERSPPHPWPQSPRPSAPLHNTTPETATPNRCTKNRPATTLPRRSPTTNLTSSTWTVSSLVRKALRQPPFLKVDYHPRRPHCSRTLGSALREVAPPAPKWWNKIIGERDEDEFVGGSAKARLPRPGRFAPMTPIESSIIRRSNYEVIARCLVIASILTGALAGGLYAVPVKAH